ncbi:sec-independent protein translocase protein TatB [Nonomuraea maritima]|uniref:Sec-independent protein translocase protein TatB n=1 Tax=Nonomuraea maritima TaxID=683260 RepID=A0A1G9QYZ8_9ACTN|nr:sec-independent translocase [Nonomuraea maritima]SDM15807.1 sec-independent protein translocase protein TatB [Nonomuraea maritima]
MFGLGWAEIGALIVIALLVFGPDKLPQVAAQAGRTLRNLRRMANNARDDLRAGLGPEFSNFDPADLNPRTFVQKHILSEVEDSWDDKELAPATAQAPPPEQLGYGEIPPYDSEAT